MDAPPTTNWPCGDGRYAVFLSHYKAEAGSDARYMRDLLQRMLKVPAYLDSTELADLGRLFAEGVDCSDALVMLGSAGVLSRPWCLAELHEAMKHNVPILFLDLQARAAPPPRRQPPSTSCCPLRRVHSDPPTLAPQAAP